MLIDTHMHFEPFTEEEVTAVVGHAREVGVTKMIVSFCERDEIRHTKCYPQVEGLYYSFGFHPSEAGKIVDADLLQLKTVLKEGKGVVALGEIGLDYHYGKEDAIKQRQLFQLQLAMAKELGLPVVIHSRDATQETLELLRDYQGKGVIHCFSGSIETAKEYIKLGFYLGIGGVVTFSNSKLLEVVREIGLEHIVLETDSPYLAPVPYRGEKNEPAHVYDIARFLSEKLSLPLEEVARITTRNACRLFDLTC